jgi:flavin reductase (DIM6/NTAB) family NADH-FMN oxidoreductase RutF
MEKVQWKAGTMLYPLPAVMVSCGIEEEELNIITISWTGTVNTDPAMLFISIRPERHSYDIIKKTGEFVLNLTNKELAYATDWCGVKSGKEFNKFKEMKLTPMPSTMIKTPMIAEAPISIECKVTQIIPLGTHDMFLAKVLAVHADKQYLDPETGAFNMQKAGLIAYSHGMYYELGNQIGKFGFSVKKKRGRKKKK